MDLAVKDMRRHAGRFAGTVVGLTSKAVDLGGNPLVYMSLPDAQEVLYQRDNEAIRSARFATKRALEAQGYSPGEAERLYPVASGADTRTIAAVLVKLKPGADVAAVKAGVEERLFLSAFTPDEQRDLLLRGRLMRMTQVLGLFRTLLVIVSVVIMALIVYVLTMDKIRSIATLKLIGAGNLVIVRLILEQSVLLAMLGASAAYELVSLTHSYFPRTLVFEPFDTIVTFTVLFVGSVIASLLGIWRALRTPPSLALGG